MKKSLSYEEVPLFDRLTASEIRKVLPCIGGYQKSFHKGEILILDEENVHHIGVVLSGSVHMVKEDLQGSRSLLAFMQPGDLFGETFAVQSDAASRVSFLAGEETTVLFAAVAKVIHTCPHMCPFHMRISENLFHLLGQKNLRLIEKIEICSRPTLRGKLMAYLRILQEKQHSDYVVSPLTRTALAEYLCSNRSAMTRELAAMRNDGLIDYDGCCYRILR